MVKIASGIARRRVLTHDNDSDDNGDDDEDVAQHGGHIPANAALLRAYTFDIGRPLLCGQLTPVKTWYPLTSIT